MKVFHAINAQKYGLFLLLFATLIPAGFGAEVHNLPLEERVRRLESAAAGINSGDNAWMLTSSALVLMMTAPGLILFYGGLVRSKNVLGTMMHSLFLMALMSILWALF